MYGTIGSEFAVGDIAVDFIVEYDAILQDFHNRRTFVATGRDHTFFRYFEVYIDSASEEMPPCSESEFSRNERIFDSSVR